MNDRPEPKSHFLKLLGGGGHAVVVAEAARLAGHTISGVYDDSANCTAVQGTAAIPHLGPLQPLLGEGNRIASLWVLCVGDCRVRRSILEHLAAHHASAATIIHPRAFVSQSAATEPGVFVGPLAVVHACARVGAHAIVNSTAVVEHDCHVGENAHIAPSATLGGHVTVGRDTLVGLGAAVLPGVRIGSGCVVGAGSVVREDVPDNSRVAGNPARPISGCSSA